MNPTRAFLLAAGFALFAAGCKGPSTDPPPSPPPAVAPAAKKAALPAAQPGQAVRPPAPAVPPAPPVFAYNPVGLRDPFEPFIKLVEEKKVRETAPRLVVPQTPLQRYSTDELKLAGVVWGDEGKARALIEDPQGKGYAVGIGTLVGDRGGRVARILADRIIIEERFKDILGEEKKNVANMMLHKSEGGVVK